MTEPASAAADFGSGFSTSEQVHRDHLLSQIVQGILTAHVRLDHMEEQLKRSAAEGVRHALEDQVRTLRAQGTALEGSLKLLAGHVSSLGQVEDRLCTVAGSAAVRQLEKPLETLRECESDLRSCLDGFTQHRDALTRMEERLRAAAIQTATDQLAGPVGTLAEYALLAEEHVAALRYLHGELHGVEVRFAAAGTTAVQNEVARLLDVVQRESRELQSHSERLTTALGAEVRWEGAEARSESAREHEELREALQKLESAHEVHVGGHARTVVASLAGEAREIRSHIDFTRKEVANSLAEHNRTQGEHGRALREHVTQTAKANSDQVSDLRHLCLQNFKGTREELAGLRKQFDQLERVLHEERSAAAARHNRQSRLTLAGMSFLLLTGGIVALSPLLGREVVLAIVPLVLAFCAWIVHVWPRSDS